MGGGGNVGGNDGGSQATIDDGYLSDSSYVDKNATEFEFRILYECENGQSSSYCGYQKDEAGTHRPPTFIDTKCDGANTSSLANIWENAAASQYVFTTAEIIEKTKRMVSCSYHNYPSSSFGSGEEDLDVLNIMSPTYFRDDNWMGLETGSNGDGSIFNGNDRSTDTGSFSFVEKINSTTTNNPLKRFKFFGNKVCNLLGLPEDVWIYTDSVRIHAETGSSHAFQGTSIMNEVAIVHGFSIANQGSVTSDIPFQIFPQVPE